MDPLSYLFGLEQFGIKLGLENITAIVDRLGRPDRTFASIHIAGTNGKGSVTAMVDAALRAAGHRSARYTSPHFIDLAERFVIDGRPVAQADLVAAAADVREVVEQLRAEGTLDVHPTFFEVTTALAFELFRRARVEAAVLEAGLGGRLDATNVVSPIATAITSIAFDHQLYLGNTLREIAAEKAGIIKSGIPVVVGPLPPEAMEAIAAVAATRRAPLVCSTPADAASYVLGLRGDHQRANAGVAVRLLEAADARLPVPPASIADGLARPGWPGRLDERQLANGRAVLLDAAHNPAGAAALASYLSLDPVKRPLVFGAMRDKDFDGMFAELLPAISALIVTQASNPRAANPDVLAARARARTPALRVHTESSLGDALDAAWRLSPRIVVAGSIFLLGDVMQLLGLHL